MKDFYKKRGEKVFFSILHVLPYGANTLWVLPDLNSFIPSIFRSQYSFILTFQNHDILILSLILKIVHDTPRSLNSLPKQVSCFTGRKNKQKTVAFKYRVKEV